jgi:hypothetical protein
MYIVLIQCKSSFVFGYKLSEVRGFSALERYALPEWMW